MPSCEGICVRLLEPFLLRGRALPPQGVQSMAELLDLVQSLGLGAVLAITVLQLVRYNRQLKAETYLTVVQLYFELQGRYVDHPEISAEPDRPFTGADLGTPRAFLVDQDLTLTETIYLMFKKYRFFDPALCHACPPYRTPTVSSTLSE